MRNETKSAESLPVRPSDFASAIERAEVAVLGPFHRQKVACLAWAPDGKALASVGGDVEHSVALWGSSTGGWDDARRVAYSPGDHQAVLLVPPPKTFDGEPHETTAAAGEKDDDNV